ncbi:conserved hypothetical protein [Ricinus communis]|uniref:Retrotransposon gag domain-containing protein n=1 Tax=Ricinus communis TaxID=3988 RepID=B9SUV5_RICCO|nr:conserved hypothetical protein [Ricinus communis]
MSRARRDPPPTEAEVTRQVLARIQEQIQQLATAMQSLTTQRGPPLIEHQDEQQEHSDDDENPFAGNVANPIVQQEDDWRWEQGFKFEIPKFHGSPTTEELLDWIVMVEEILEFKHIPWERCVPIIAMRFHNGAAAGWT